MKHLFTLLLIVSTLFFSATVIRAVSSTPSAQTEEEQASPDSEIRNNLQNRIRNIVQQNLSTTEAELAEKVAQNKLVGYTGIITAISTESITVKFNGDIFQVSTGEKTTYYKAGQNAKFTSLAIGDKAIVIGLLPKADILDAKRIVVIKDTPSSLPQVIFGTIKTVNTKTRIITISSGETENEMIISRKANLSVSDFEEGKKAVVIVRDQNGDSVITQAKVF